MAANAKGKRKVKGKTLDLNSFLAEDQDAPSGFAVVQPKRIDWADAMDNEDDERYTLDYKKEEKVVLPTAPKSARGLDVDLAKIPSDPPFTAFLGNLSYDISEDDIAHFFRQLQVKNVRIPREGGDKGRVKGFGYAEFCSKQDLIQALAMSSESLKNRAVKITLAGEHDGGDRRNNIRDGPDRTQGDWRSGRETSQREDNFRNDSYQSSRSSGASDSYKPRSTYEPPRGFDRNGDRSDRPDYGSRPDRDFGRDSDRFERKKGYDFTDRGRPGGGRDDVRRDNFSRDSMRDNYGRDSGREVRSSDRDYPPRDNYDRRPPDRTPQSEGGENKERRKLQLAPRTKPIEPVPPPAEAVAKSSIFGAAKPVDTAAREREIEARLFREKDPGLPKDPKESKETEARVRKFSSGSGVSSRSRRSSDSGPEGETVPTYKPPIPRQNERESQPQSAPPKPKQANSTNGSEKDHQVDSRATAPPLSKKENYSDSSVKVNENKYEEGGFKPARQNHAHRDSSKERTPHGVTYEEPEPPVYTSANKFSHLMHDGEDAENSE